MNIFLYSLYTERYNEAQNVVEIGEKSIETRLKDDKITHPPFSNTPAEIAYISADLTNFREQTLGLQNQDVRNIGDNKIRSTFDKPVKLTNMDGTSLKDFVTENIYKGSEYVLWEIDREERRAKFFQRVKNRTIYYNKYGTLDVFWNEKDEIVVYEQTKLESIKNLEQSDSVMPETQVVRALYDKGILRPEMKIVHMKLGYSTLAPATERQVLVPTWEIRLKLPNGTTETHFVNNSLEGKVVDLKEQKEE